MQEIHLMSEVDLITLICLVDNLVLLCDLCTIIRKKHKNTKTVLQTLFTNLCKGQILLISCQIII